MICEREMENGDAKERKERTWIKEKRMTRINEKRVTLIKK
jgi:hypothetical protein